MTSLFFFVLLIVPVTLMYFFILYFPFLKSELYSRQVAFKALLSDPSPKPVPFEPLLITSNIELCKNSPNLDWIVYMCSSGKDFERRSLVRQTWANTKLFKDFSFKVIFLLGRASDDIQQKVEEESEKYGDIVQADFVDSFRNLTLKVLVGLRWISTYCPHVPYAVKADDDMFVNIFSIAQLLKENRKKSNVILCRIWEDNTMPILRDPKTCGRYCAEENDFPTRDVYPQYCSGPFYVISGKLVKELYDASRSTPYFFCEDVYVTGLLTQKISDKIHYVRIGDRFKDWEDALPTYKNKSQPMKGDLIHIGDRAIQIDLWNSLLDRLTDSQKALLQQDVSTYKVY